MGFFDTSADVLDLRDVVEAGREYFETWADDDATPDDRQEAYEALQELDRVQISLGLGGIGYAGALDALEAYANDEPTLIAESYFETYAEELAEELGMIQQDAGWPSRHIDWEAAANELRQDYNEVELEGHTYLIRAV